MFPLPAVPLHNLTADKVAQFLGEGNPELVAGKAGNSMVNLRNDGSRAGVWIFLMILDLQSQN